MTGRTNRHALDVFRWTFVDQCRHRLQSIRRGYLPDPTGCRQAELARLIDRHASAR